MLQSGDYVAAKSVARWFVNHADRGAGEAITHLKLQKLVYYAQAWFLANFDRSLFEPDMQAWAHGPVLPELYFKYRGMGWEALPPERGTLPPVELSEFLTAVVEEYGQFSAKKLELLTHEELPWIEARGKLPPEAASTNTISKLTMRNYYAKKIGRKEIKKLSH